LRIGGFASISCFAVLALVCTAAAAGAQGVADVSVRDARGGVRIEIAAEVVTHAADGLVMKPASGQRAPVGVPPDELVRVEYAQPPEEWRRAMRAVAAGDWSGATALLGELASDDAPAARHPWLREDAMFWLWVVAQRRGRADESATTAASLLEAFPKSRHAPALALSAAEARAAAGEAEEAARLFASARADALAKGWGEGVRLRVRLAEVRTSLEAGDAGRAEKALAAWRADAAAGSADAAMYLQTAEALVLGARAKRGAAQATLAKVVASGGHADVLLRAAASAGLAEAAEQTGDIAGAVLEWSRLPAESYDDPRGMDAVGWALWRWSSAYRRWAEAGGDAAEKRLRLERARALRERAARDFPLTRGGRAALADRDR
jgi:hypothetical protein